MGVNDSGLVCVIMNRAGTLGPDPRKRSRGELVLEGLDHGTARSAATALSALAPTAYRPFNLLVGDAGDCFWVRNDGDRVTVSPIPPGLHMLTSLELDDEADPRIRHYLPYFHRASEPDVEQGDWRDWEKLLGSRDYPPGEARSAAMCFKLDTGLSTLSSSLIALPGGSRSANTLIWRHTLGPPEKGRFAPVDLAQ